MALPLRIEEDKEIKGMMTSLDVLIENNFVGTDHAFLQTLLKEFSCNTVGELLEKVLNLVLDEIDPAALNISDIENFDVMSLMNVVTEKLQYKSSIDFESPEGKKFRETVKSFIRNLLHNVAFPMMVLENPNVAVSVKNLLKRTVYSVAATDEEIDVQVIEEALDLDNLPTTFSMELFKKLGGKIPGTENFRVMEITESPDVNAPILYCELSSDQAIYLAYILENNYEAILKWRKFKDLLKTRDGTYDTVKVAHQKIGLVVAIIKELHSRTTTSGERYLSMSNQNGIYPIFQQQFISSKTDTFFEKELKRYPTKKDRELAKSIVDDLLAPHKQIQIIEDAKQFYKEDKV